MSRTIEGAHTRVFFDDQIFLRQAVGGVSRYFVALMQAYRSDAALGVQVVSGQPWTSNLHMVEAGLARRLPESLSRHQRLIKCINGRQKAQHTADIVHHTYYDQTYLSRRSDTRLRVVTIYDMIPELFPNLFPGGNPHTGKRAFVDAADLILCISEATKRDLIDLYGLPAAPIAVTLLGVDDRFHPGALRLVGLPEAYVLYVGKRDGYKDFTVLTKAFANSDIPRDVILVVIGGRPFSQDEQQSLIRLGILDRVRQIDLDDADLGRAYSNALCFAFPSRYEGFGLPTLEAMASGCATILAASSAMREVGGEAALYFAPGDDAGLSNALNRVVCDVELRDRHRLAGLARAARFSWRHTAAHTASAYRRALAKP